MARDRQSTVFRTILHKTRANLANSWSAINVSAKCLGVWKGANMSS